jgi:hypothetical protein
MKLALITLALLFLSHSAAGQTSDGTLPPSPTCPAPCFPHSDGPNLPHSPSPTAPANPPLPEINRSVNTPDWKPPLVNKPVQEPVSNARSSDSAGNAGQTDHLLDEANAKTQDLARAQADQRARDSEMVEDSERNRDGGWNRLRRNRYCKKHRGGIWRNPSGSLFACPQ